MSKNLKKTVASIACAAMMATQVFAFNASAVEYNNGYYYYYNGVYYSSDVDAQNVSGGAVWEAVPTERIPSNATERWIDPKDPTRRFTSREEAEAAGVNDPHVVYIGTYNSSYSSAYGAYYSSVTGKYYSSYSEALSASGGVSSYVTWVANYYNYGSGYYYSSYTGKTYTSYAAALAASNGNSSYVTYIAYDTGYGSGYYYSSYTGKYYSSYSSALAASNGNSSYVTYVAYNTGYGSGYYYSSYTGKYYSSYSSALAASNGNSSYVTYVGSLYYSGYDGAASSIYRYYYNGVAYPSLDAAVAAGGTIGVDIYYSSVGSTGDTKYYYYYNGTYYGSLQAAIAAGGTALGVDISYVPYNYYGTTYNYYTYGYGYLTNPYLTYSNLFSSSSSTADEAEDGEPYIYGNKTKAGWSTIVKYINAASKGANIKVDMNGSTVVDDSVFEALDGKNVSVTFVLDNGVKWTVNGKNVDKAQDVNIYTEYNIDYIPAALVKKAVSGAVSKAQVGISNSYNDFGTTASVTVKFNKKRADLTAVVYRYNPDSNSLKAVYKSKVQSDGSCTFTVDQGGPYLIVLK